MFSNFARFKTSVQHYFLENNSRIKILGRGERLDFQAGY